ncbi:hypothetical protein A2755_00645 [Candidatus Wolfebacteria bacterium RIFCSPHIGHO2_01_FULL_48_22]|uniref:Uncharacterized protein n=2 Tax=Candidatus Wolfeibacteriota TaxID=1752735 RepID=A0A1F8DV43_9BACT|nr:MAG: hypothetical protein A2755_00645 [Candidatus Wolfebacteria bacterium RIFCSPHIGHO2_01_FULL_48_22]OGM94055.1 MAG: hypothetical protein A2935_02755 [Candidatus Wolfebacteria bacterium RIFCSPLOWO2_01_FULL_47_17b]
MKKRTKKVYVYYHKDCFDGFCAAWVVWKKLGEKAAYTALLPDSLPKKLPHNSLLFFVDLCPRGNKIALLKKKGNVVTVIDHHQSSAAYVAFADDYLFDTKKSGAGLAWKYFFAGGKAPWLVRYVEDGDLWRRKYSQTNLVRNMLALEGMDDFNRWGLFAKKVENPKTRRIIFTGGKLIEKYRQRLIEESAARAQKVRFEGHTVYAVNESTESIRSEVAHVLYAKLPPFSIVWAQDESEIHISLRSEKGLFDVTRLAKKYGGGGHPVAAGIRLPLGTPLPWKIVKKSNGKK